MRNKFKSFLLAAACCLGLNAVWAQDAPTIHTIGDSTMEEKSTDPSINTNGQRGWPQMLPQFMINGATLNNRAKSGTSSKTFYENSRFWTTVKPQIKEGDWVIIQFGHNDEKHDGADGETGTYPWTTYKEYLTKYVNEVRELKANPILFTPIVRGYFSAGKITDKGAHNLGPDNIMNSGRDLDYVAAMKEVAQETNCPLVDHTALTRAICDEYGAEKTGELIYNVGDGTHIGEYGASLYARLAVQGLLAEGLLTEYFNADPEVMINPTSYDYGKTYVNAGAVYAFSISGIDLEPQTGTVNVVASENFLVSLDAADGFTSTLDIPYENGNVPMTNLYVKFLPTTQGVKEGTVTISNGTSTKTVALTGEGVSFEGGAEAMVYWELTANADAEVTGPVVAGEEVFSQMYVNRYAVPGSASDPAQWEGGLIDPSTKVQRCVIEGDAWPEGEIDVNYNRYVEFSVKANEGTVFNVDSIGMYVGGNGGSGMCFRVMCSTDPGFSEYTLISNRPNNAKNVMYQVSLKQIMAVDGGETLYVRIYPWYNSAATGKSLCIYGVTVKGVVTESGDVSIGGTDAGKSVYCYPAVTEDATNLRYSLQDDGEVCIRLQDAYGRMVWSESSYRQAGAYDEPLSLGALPQGIYFCTVESAEGSETVRIVKK